jgi:hypothetical protein
VSDADPQELFVSNFIIPDRALPDGSIEWREHTGTAAGLTKALKDYDPRLALVLSIQTDEWEIWRTGEDNVPRRISRLGNNGRIPSIDATLNQLKAYDTRNGYDPFAEAVADDDRRAIARAQEFEDQNAELADKLHHGLSKDLAAHEPAVRPVSMGTR